MNRSIQIVLFGLAAFAAAAQNFDETRLRKHIGYLASDELQGRGTGSEGERKAADYIAGQFREIGLRPLSPGYIKPFSFRHNPNPHDTSSGKIEVNSRNVIGFLDNGSESTIVVGAHYDHLGLGKDHNSLEANSEGKIHNGADDNASGTAGVIELARHFSGNGVKEKYNFLFICFSGEELGLIGSKKWCDNPDIELKTINCMINMDMIGRLNDSTDKLIVYGVGTSPAFVPMLDSIKAGLQLKKDSSGTGPSDQTSFYLKDIPVLHFFTGQHSDYHKPSDDADKINYPGVSRVLTFIVQVIEETMRQPTLPFTKTRSPEGAKVRFKVTLGVMPDYAFDGKGMRIDGVSEGRPAANAGLMRNDVIIGLGGEEVSDIHGYMKALSRFGKGDSTTVEVNRGGEVLKFTVTF